MTASPRGPPCIPRLGEERQPDLYVDFDALDRSRRTIEDVSDVLRRACSAMRDLPADAAGQEVLRRRLREFGDEWDYGIDQLGKFSKGCGEALRSAVDTFRDLDAELAAALEKKA